MKRSAEKVETILSIVAKDLVQAEDGTWWWYRDDGAWTAESLRIIADELERRNKL